MPITTLFNNGRSQAVRLPKEFRLAGKTVSIRRLGDGVLLTPTKATDWPAGYFAKIQITDENFVRSEQGKLPPAPDFSA